ncbi:MAG: ABC transporter transmembrane domain-containing protein [Chloroflexi bacterium]|nr:ABC transporter transmembrane domain-containing protein [Chloroflexota bacterium]
MNGMTTGRSPADRLLELALFHGETFIGGGNRPVRLSDPDTFWFVVKGAVDVFATKLGDDGVPSDFRHMLRAGPGRLLFPAPEAAGLGALVAKGLPDSELRRIAVTDLVNNDLATEIVEQANHWVSEFSESVARNVTFRPRIEWNITPGTVGEAIAGTTISPHDAVVWVSSKDGRLLYLATEDLEQSGNGLVPVTASSWVLQSRTGSVKAASTEELHQAGLLLEALKEFNQLAMRADLTNQALLLADLSNLQTASARHHQRSEERARLNLLGLRDGDLRQGDDGSDLLRALEWIGRHEGIVFRSPQRERRGASDETDTTLNDILSASGIHARRVSLRDRHRWWLSDSGAMLASLREDGSPVALIPGPSGRYRMVNPQTGSFAPVTARRAHGLEQTAWFFYCPLPEELTTKAGPLLRLSFTQIWGDLARLLGAGLLSGLASLAPAVFLGVFASHVLPSGDVRMLAMLALALVLIGLNFALLQMMKGTAVMRLEARAAARISAALWDRMLVLPSRFFRRWTVGDLGNRAMGFHHLRNQVAGVVGGTLLSLIFLLPTFPLMFLYDAPLGWPALGLGMLSLVVALYFGLRQLPHHRQVLTASRELAGVLIQLIGGIAKLRSSGAEGSAFAIWAANYRRQKRVEMRLGALNDHLVAFTSAAPFFAMAALLAVALPRIDQGLSIADLW